MIGLFNGKNTPAPTPVPVGGRVTVATGAVVVVVFGVTFAATGAGVGVVGALQVPEHLPRGILRFATPH